MEDNKLIYECLYGCRKGSGTENAVTNVVNYIFSGLDQAFRGIAGIFYDFSKASRNTESKVSVLWDKG